MRQLFINAFAKINLCLRVLDRRPDGYHNINSIMQTISLCDYITIKKIGRGIKINCAAKGVPCGRGNLAYAAAKLFFAIWGKAGGVEISIDKQIPAGAGLAGGSADAAAVLVGLNKLFKAGFTPARLREAGSRLGSDVPFCLMGGRARVLGRGEILLPQKRFAKKWVVLVSPGFAVSTKWAYAQLDRQRALSQSSLGQGRRTAHENNVDCRIKAGYHTNDFERVVFGKYPRLKALKQKLQNLGAEFAQMSGSGSALFGIFSSKKQAESARQKLAGLNLSACLATFI